MSIDNLNELLQKVQRPARYIGGEQNQTKKEWTPERVKVLMAFPDVYDVGMSYLGMKILYSLINKREDSLCERVFSPWPDLEAVLREGRIELFSLESRRKIREFDIIGFSLAYELNFTNVLNIIDLGRIPLRSSERTDEDPIIIAGGPSCYNPEPMAEFIDAFIIGDGEEAIEEIVEAYKGARVKGQGSRRRMLKELAKIKGVYVPSLYNVEYNDDNTIKRFFPIEEDLPARIEKRYVKDLNAAYYPTDQLVPYIQIVHDRIPIEIMRGCKHACKFCLSGATYRPSRERTKETILELARQTYKRTGYEEISLLSLSSGDHSQIVEIIKEMNEAFKGKAVSISIPSLRVEDILSNLPLLLSQVKKPGLTFAPESGSERLRKLIHKNIDIEKLYQAVTESFKAGWNKVKLYFIIGLPTETDEDLIGILDLAETISNLRKPIDNKRAQVTCSINAFVPKPHTPFQWNGMERLDELFRKRDLLRRSVRSRAIELDFNSFERGYLESVFSRGDRRFSEAIYAAWKAGARFDSWSDFFSFDLWLKAFKEVGIDPDFYATRKRDENEILPWDFIDVGVKKETLLKLA